MDPMIFARFFCSTLDRDMWLVGISGVVECLRESDLLGGDTRFYAAIGNLTQNKPCSDGLRHFLSPGYRYICIVPYVYAHHHPRVSKL